MINIIRPALVPFLLRLLVSGILLLNIAHANDSCQDLSSNTTTDHFEHKVNPTASQLWSISYHSNYKIVRTSLGSYLLRQCDPPPALNANFDGVFSIPFSSAAVEQSTAFSYLEQLGLLQNKTKAVLFNPVFVASPCALEKIQNGDILVVKNEEEQQALVDQSLQNETLAATLERMIIFQAPYNQKPLFGNPVRTLASMELTSKASFEWIKFYSVFFNLEARANQLFEAATGRYECVSQASQAQKSSSTVDTPLVLWAYYSQYCGGWSVAECPNYYCDLATDCSASMLDGTNAIKSIASETCGLDLMTLEEFVEFGKEADYWIYASPDWESTYSAFKESLDQFKAVQNQQVFDQQASGENSWFENRVGAYYDVLQDFCSVSGTTNRPEDHWSRNVFSEPLENSFEQECDERKELGALRYNNTCDDASIDNVSTLYPSSEPSLAPSAWPTQVVHPDIVKVIVVPGRDPGGLGWADSYSVGDECFCATTFDHNIGSIEVSTPLGLKTVLEICALLGPGPGLEGRPIYNDIQCGNGPANDAGDEDDCPGRVDIGRRGCGHIGPLWNFSKLLATTGPTAPLGSEGVPTEKPTTSPSSSISSAFPSGATTSVKPSAATSVGNLSGSNTPSLVPTTRPTVVASVSSARPSQAPSDFPSTSTAPSHLPSDIPSEIPTISDMPSDVPSDVPSTLPSDSLLPSGISSFPSAAQSTGEPIAVPSDAPVPSSSSDKREVCMCILGLWISTVAALLL